MIYLDNIAAQRAYDISASIQNTPVAALETLASFLCVSKKDALQHAISEGLPLFVGGEALTKFIYKDFERPLGPFPLDPDAKEGQ